MALNAKHHYKITTVLFVFVLICLISDLVWTILHPRPTRFLWFWVLLYFAVKIFREKNFKKYLIEIPLILVLISVFLYLPNAAWPYRAPWEYKGETAYYKNTGKRIKQEFGKDYYNEYIKESGEKYKIFPDAIPRTAKCVRWYNFPGFWQARMRIYLSMKMPAEYIRDTVKHYSPSAKILSYDEEWPGGWWDSEGDVGWDSFPGIDYEDKQAENVIIYLLSDSCDNETGYGF